MGIAPPGHSRWWAASRLLPTMASSTRGDSCQPSRTVEVRGRGHGLGERRQELGAEDVRQVVVEAGRGDVQVRTRLHAIARLVGDQLLGPEVRIREEPDERRRCARAVRGRPRRDPAAIPSASPAGGQRRRCCASRQSAVHRATCGRRTSAPGSCRRRASAPTSASARCRRRAVRVSGGSGMHRSRRRRQRISEGHWAPAGGCVKMPSRHAPLSSDTT